MSEYTSEDYARANKINARLATAHDPQLVDEGRTLAQRMIEYVRGELGDDDFDEFVERVHRSESFSLTEAVQLKKEQKPLKQILVRAESLLQTIEEAETRKR